MQKTNPRRKARREGAPQVAQGKILCGDNVTILRRMESNSVDLVVTSPPYDEIRDYIGKPSFDLHAVGAELFRVAKEGAIAAVVLQDGTKDGAKSLTTFRTAVDWCDNIGWRLFECPIYYKNGTPGAWWNKRFRVDHEYILLFLKGMRPAYFNKEPLKVPAKHGGEIICGSSRRTDGSTGPYHPVMINPMKCRGTVWNYFTCGDGSRLKHQHPAPMPNLLPYDLIECFCIPGGVVLDPFNGGGTTCVAAKSLGRSFIGIDIAEKYCQIARERVATEEISRG